MKISYNWISSYFESPLPKPAELADLITMHSFEVESIEEQGSDHVFDFKILPDRAHDCMSHMGIAREVEVLTGIKMKSNMDHKRDFFVSNKLQIEIDNVYDTPRFAGVLIENIKVGESPKWMKDFLESVGQKPINNIVDAANLCMLHRGQPMHAYDASKLKSKDGKLKIRVERTTAEGEKFMALGDKEYELPLGTLVVRDSHSGESLGIAGIKGGKASEIDETTTSIIIEAANFNSTRIRKTSQALRLRTDASMRFEKEITPELVMRAVEDMTALVLEMDPHVHIEGLVDLYPKKRNPYIIGVSLSEINLKLGTNLQSREVEDILKRFNFEYKKVRPVDEVVKSAPSFVGVPYKYGTSISYDAPQSFDCSAFVAYLYSQSGVALPRITVDQFAYGQEIAKESIQPGDAIFSKNGDGDEMAEFTTVIDGQTVSKKVVHSFSVEFPGLKIPEGVEHVGIYLGDNKVIHASGKWYKGEVVIEDLDSTPAFKEIRGYRRFSDNEERYVVTVPAERLDLMSKRAFLVSGNKEDLIEEIGRVYGYENVQSEPLKDTDFEPVVNKELYYSEEIRHVLKSEGFSEVVTYAFKDRGEVEVANPIARDKAYLRDSLLPGLEKAYEENKRNKDLLGIEKIKIFEIGKVFHKDREILSFASVPSVSEVLGQKIDTAEIDLGEMIESLPMLTVYDFKPEAPADIFKPFSPYPFITRDLAIFVPEGVEPSEVEEMFAPLLSDLCIKKTLFDSFLKTMPTGDKKQSYAWRFVFQSMDRTLTDVEINEIMKKVYDRLGQQKDFEIR